MAECDKQYNCPPTPCRLDNAIKEYKKSRGGINDPSLKPLLTIIDELRNLIFCNETASSALSSSYALTASYALNGGSGGSSLQTGSTYPFTSSWALNALNGGTTLYTGSTYPFTSSWAVNVESASYTLTSSTTPFNGNRAIKREDPDFEGLNVGGGTVVDFLNNFFFPFIPASVSLTLVPSTTLYEIGNDPSPTIRVNVTANDETLFESGSVRKDGTNTWTITKPVLPATNYDNVDSNITTGHTYQAYISASNDGTPGLIASNTRTISFVYPYFWGLSTNPSLSGTTLYGTLTKTIQSYSATNNVSFTGTATYIYFCYPDTYTDIVYIYDYNDFDVTNLFQSSTVSVTSTGLTSNWTTNYKVWRLKSSSNPNGTYKFRTTPL